MGGFLVELAKNGNLVKKVLKEMGQKGFFDLFTNKTDEHLRRWVCFYSNVNLKLYVCLKDQ